MVLADDDAGRGRVDPEKRQEYWDLYAGENCFTRQELEAFRAVQVTEFSLNKVAPIIDGYIATLDPMSLEPVIDAEDAATIPLVDLANAFLGKSRKASKVGNVEEQVPLHFMITSVAASMSTVVSDNGRTKHRVEMLRPEEVRWDPRAVEPNAEDALWFARISSYNTRELKLKLPRIWQRVKKGRSSEQIEELFTTTETLFCNAEGKGSKRAYIEVVTFEWRELRSYMMIPHPLSEYDTAAAQEHSFEITVDGLKLENDEVDQFAEWMGLYGQDPGFERARDWQGEAYYYAIVVGNEIVESGQLDEGCFRIQLCCGPEISTGPSRVKYRSICGDLAAPQKLTNHALTSELTTISKMSRGVHAVKRGALGQPEMMRRFSTPGAVIEMDDPANDYKNISPDMSVLEPTLAVLQIAAEAMDQRMGTSTLSRGNVASGDKVTRTSAKTVETLLERADAPVKAYYARYMRWRASLAKCMCQQITHWTFEELAKMLGPETVMPIAQMYGTMSVPSGALWQVSIDLREPQRRQKAQIAADVLGQGLLPQLQQLGLPLPPDIIMELVLPLFSLTEMQVERWKMSVQQAQAMQQMQAAEGQPPPEVPN